MCTNQAVPQHPKFFSLQMLQTAASLIVDDGMHSEALTLGQPEYSTGNAQRRRLGNRKRKRRPQQSATGDDIDSPTASNSPPYWRGQVEDDKEAKSSSTKSQETEQIMRPSLQASFKRRKQPAIREPLAALEKEQKLYEMRNKPETSTDGNVNVSRNSANLKNILKNSGGLSLSEILQQKNLSLDDLLKGKQNALQALQTTATAPQEKVIHAKYPSFKANFKPNPPPPPSVKLTEGSGEEVYNSKEKSKLTALHRLKLFGSSSRPSGLQVGLADHLTTRKRDGVLYSSTSSTTTTTTTPKPSTTKIPLYKKILHQRPTLKPTFLLKNTAVMASAEPERVVTSWDSKEEAGGNDETEVMKMEEDMDMELMEDDDWKVVPSVIIPSTIPPELTETTTWKLETTMAPTTTSTTSSTTTTTTSTPKPITEKSTNRDITTSTRRMYTSTRGSGRTTYRYTTSSTTPAPTTSTTTEPPTTTTTPLPITTTTTTSTTTASSSTMNLTPKANLNLNTEDIRERIQETLLKNLIEKDDSFKKSPASEENDSEEDDDLENFFEETIKPKTIKYFETSTITTRMKQYTPSSFSYTSSSTTTTNSPEPSTTPTENPNIIPDFDNVDDRTDLLELIEDRRSGNRLFKVLEQRNMTLEELIEHRKRGSSQLHLATIVESPSRFYPDKKVVLQDNMDIVTAFENFPHFNLLNLKSVKPDDIKTDSQGSSYFTSIIDIEPTDEVYKNRKGGGQALAGELDKASLLPDRSEKSLGFFPSWKTLALASLGPSNNNKDAATMHNSNANPYYLQQPKMLLENNSNNDDENNVDDDEDDEDVYDIKENELTLMGHDNNDDNENDYQSQNPIQAAVRLPERTAEAIENEVARAHDLVDLELSGHGFKRSPQAAGALAHSHRHGSFYTNMPPGIKSAIVASATIVLTALVTFMVIFAVCKWKQRRHRMSNIMKSYNAMKSKLPTIAATATAANANTTSCNTTNPNSRRSSFREMQNLLGGSGLSVAATITTTSTGVPNTPIHNSSLTPSPQLTASQLPTTMLAGNCSKNINNMYYQHANNSISNNTSNSSSCGLRPLQRQSSLLFQRSFNQNINNSHNNINSNNDKPTNLAILSGCNLLDLKRNNKMSGSTTSLSFSLTSGHNISNSHINTMDANSPEVQEYLFDTLRNSF
ncbi:nuclear pore complex protein DDB_G0274915-like [Calliphora vicina]|uniref:nuclear pore complex protein DDB_G0274915-like n=1 Tax=Calliphora vicina TaxID=7373 RepID=UPI00325AF5CA